MRLGFVTQMPDLRFFSRKANGINSLDAPADRFSQVPHVRPVVHAPPGAPAAAVEVAAALVADATAAAEAEAPAADVVVPAAAATGLQAADAVVPVAVEAEPPAADAVVPAAADAAPGLQAVDVVAAAEAPALQPAAAVPGQVPEWVPGLAAPRAAEPAKALAPGEAEAEAGPVAPLPTQGPAATVDQPASEWAPPDDYQDETQVDFAAPHSTARHPAAQPARALAAAQAQPLSAEPALRPLAQVRKTNAPLAALAR